MIHNSPRSGFTLIEVIISLAILVIVSSFIFFAFTGYKGGKNIELTMNELVAVIRDAQRRSITEQDGKQWGVRFTNSTSTAHSHETFSGASYSSSSVSSTNPLKRSVAFSNPGEGLNIDMVFSAISGKLGDTRIISLVNQRKDNLVGDITMLSQGTITSRLDKGVVGYWHLDEGVASTTYDSSGNTNTGTLTNGPTWQSVSNCKAGACLSFDGTSDYITMGTPSSLSNLTAMTVSVWVKPNTDQTNVFVSKHDNSITSTGEDFLLYMPSGGDILRVIMNTTSREIVTANSIVLDDGNWHFVAATYDGTNVLLYHNAVQVAAGSTSGTLGGTTDVRIGHESGLGATYYMNGLIDEPRIYNRALTATEISNHYNDLK